MMGLEPDRLLHMFRVTAGIAELGGAVRRMGGAGQRAARPFHGHYLSACALMWAQTGDVAVKARGALMVTELAKCQQKHGNGYLSAFPSELFDRLKAGQRVWAPFYTYHKIMAGMLDNWTLANNPQALEMVKGMALWVRDYAQPVPDEQWQRMLNVEYGGMNDVLYQLANVTGDAQWADLAHRFDHEKIFGPLAVGRDELNKVHANTNIPKVIGAARRYERTGEDRSRAIATFFWDDVTGSASYATGGTSNDEEWQGEPGQLAKAIGPYSQETCVTYNMLKLTRAAVRLESRGALCGLLRARVLQRHSARRSIRRTARRRTTRRSPPATGSCSARLTPASGAATAPASRTSPSSPTACTSTTTTASG